MKNLMLAVALPFCLLVTLTSCQKNYVCNCTTVTSVNDSTIATSQSTSDVRATRKDARSACKGETTTYNLGVATFVNKKTCSLD